jgi:hypothetical protein
MRILSCDSQQAAEKRREQQVHAGENYASISNYDSNLDCHFGDPCRGM